MNSLRWWERVVGLAALLALSIAPVVLGDGTPDTGTEGDGGGCDGDVNVDWFSYGFANPGDPVYGFGLPDPNGQDLVGFAAKGNVILGDYRSPDFTDTVLPALANVQHTYVVDPTDEALGYCTVSASCGTPRPQFDGDYNAPDGGTKLDGTPRKFYESTLSDDAFGSYLNPNDSLYKGNVSTALDGVFFTNHAFAGRVLAKSLVMFGAIVARDDGLIRGPQLLLSHDIRLRGRLPPGVALPRDIGYPVLVSWQECTPATPCLK